MREGTKKKKTNLTAAAGLFAVERVFVGERDQKQKVEAGNSKTHRLLLTLIFTALLH